MNYKKINTQILIVLALAVLSTSCNQELDIEPLSQETSDNAYATGSQLEAALTGAYESFQSAQYYIWDHIIFQDVRSDNNYAGGDNPDIFQFDKFTVVPTNPRLFTMWSNIYNAISKSNLVMEKAPDITENLIDERRTQIIGEAHFLRAYHYFTLVKNFGGVPLQLETIKTVDPSKLQKPRNTVAEVYEQIVKDLNTALNDLPDSYGNDPSVNKARATKGAANALLAKVYAQMSEPDYQKVLDYCNAVINSPAGYSLMDDYNDLFDGNHYNNQESIIEIQFLGKDEGNYAPSLQLPNSITGTGYRKFITPSHDLIDAYDSEGDEVRKNASVIFENSPWVDEYWGNAINSSIPFTYKWRQSAGGASPDDEYLLRLGDIILLKAEALNELGQIAKAAIEVNKIRNRVNLDDLTAPATDSKESMRNAILKERRLELAFESKRWDDLVRYNKAIKVMNNVDDIDLRTGQPVDYKVTEKDLLLPIPQKEINRNPNLEQNPGY